MRYEMQQSPVSAKNESDCSKEGGDNIPCKECKCSCFVNSHKLTCSFYLKLTNATKHSPRSPFIEIIRPAAPTKATNNKDDVPPKAAPTETGREYTTTVLSRIMKEFENTKAQLEIMQATFTNLEIEIKQIGKCKFCDKHFVKPRKQKKHVKKCEVRFQLKMLNQHNEFNYNEWCAQEVKKDIVPEESLVEKMNVAFITEDPVRNDAPDIAEMIFFTDSHAG